MTNEQAKQEAIKKAYGDKWQLVKSLTPNSKDSNDAYDLYSNGYFNIKRLYQHIGSANAPIFDLELFDFDGKYIRPKSLNDFHNNNGWIRIEPDGSNLPEIYLESIFFKTIKINGDISTETIPDYLLYHLFKSGLITHYKPIEPELKPIY